MIALAEVAPMNRTLDAEAALLGVIAIICVEEVNRALTLHQRPLKKVPGARLMIGPSQGHRCYLAFGQGGA